MSTKAVFAVMSVAELLKAPNPSPLPAINNN